MTGSRRLPHAVLACAVSAGLLAACSTPATDPAELTAAPTSAAPTADGTQQPVVAGTSTTTPRSGPVQSILSPPPPVTASAPTGGSSAPADASGFGWSARTATAADLGSSWREGCPVGPSSLRVVSVTHYDTAGEVRTGTLVIHRDIESATRAAFSALFAQRFPIASITPVTAYASDDDASMAANNTSAFNCRFAVTNSATKSWSNHAYGRAIDVNPLINPYVLDGEVLPPEGAEYADRGTQHPGGLYRGGAALTAFTGNGFEWGGLWRNPDYQHLER